MLKTYQVALVLSLLMPLAQAVDAKPSSSSGFKSGFSSQHTSSTSRSSPAPSHSGGFGSFGKRAAPPDAAAPTKPSGGFGSFGGGQAAPQKSDSALSQKLNKNASEANALRTLDARRQAQADAARDTRPVPGYEQGPSGQPAPTYAPPQQQAPVIVRQDSGLGHVLAGAMIANAARGAHASNNGYPGAYPSNGGGGVTAPARGGGTSFIGLFFTLCVLVAIAWGVYFMWRRVQRARAAKKPNYSFERN
ncbi:hypothetical protein NX784_16230 [Massilia pinisoli]|uniref:Transmembrane protein n=1 Tax=Massilia pinisoli TaxID=1772194 RepID=A0ABT1ZT95_9BURK|nr:hypothetical protein [Massilia pinisoli]MCS0583138.1 hypothetical protein [Massilia pinisoli]